jgi:hypothetical protein
LKSGLREVLGFSVAIALFGCTNDYDQFDTVTGAGGASAGTVVQHDSGNDRSASGAGGSEDALREPEDGGGESSDVGLEALADASDVGSEADASVDAPVDSPVDAPADTPIDAPADTPIDSPVDAAPDVADSAAEAKLDADIDAAEVGSDAIAEADAPTGVDAPDDSVMPGADAPAEADATDGDEAEAAQSCGPGTKLCNTSCVSNSDPATGCAGASCAPCVLPHASTTCGVTGECAVLVCGSGYDDCDTMAANGCEAVLSSDVGNCGSCGRACAGDSVLSKQCAGGLCVSTCSLGHANCSYPFAGTDDGCEVAANNIHCSSCANDCTKQGSGFTCGAPVAGQCGCTADGDCRVMGSMGTCDVATGRCICDVTCQSGEACRRISGPDVDVCSCNGGNACGANQTCCQSPAGCRNLQTDPASCGGCGRSCPSGFFCSTGQCQCGADLECNAGAPGTCAAGQCVCNGITCPTGQRCQPGGTCG